MEVFCEDLREGIPALKLAYEEDQLGAFSVSLSQHALTEHLAPKYSLLNQTIESLLKKTKIKQQQQQDN